MNTHFNTTTLTDHFRKGVFTLFVTVFLLLSANPAFAQFEEPEFEKVTQDKHEWFMQKFKDVSWTGRGLYDETRLDDVQTNEIRARLQTLFGDPTKKLEDLIDNDDFRPGQAIQFEYRFVVNDSIPLIILDVFGPFGRGLSYSGASRYIDLMPQIKREFARKLMAVDDLGDYRDYFYSPEREQWYLVTYQDGNFRTEEIESPKGMSIE